MPNEVLMVWSSRASMLIMPNWTFNYLQSCVKLIATSQKQGIAFMNHKMIKYKVILSKYKVKGLERCFNQAPLIMKVTTYHELSLPKRSTSYKMLTGVQ